MLRLGDAGGFLPNSPSQEFGDTNRKGIFSPTH